MIYVIYFADEGIPKTGLSPTIDIFVKVDSGTSAGTPPSITELSGGAYKFTYTPTEEVMIRVDSEDATMSDSERYIPLIAGSHDDDLDVAVSSRSTPNDVKTTVTTRPVHQIISAGWSTAEKEKIIKKINKIESKLQKLDTKELETYILKFKKSLLELLKLANTKIFKSIEEIKTSNIKEKSLNIKALSFIKNDINELKSEINKIDIDSKVEDINIQLENIFKVLSKTLSNKELEELVNEF